MNTKFESFPLRAELLNNLCELNFSLMTPIQANSLQYILDGHDVIAQAKTGSGKTAAFGLGLLNSLDNGQMITRSLVLCPTRELAEQVAQELRKLARMMKNVKVLTLCGGTSEFFQEKSISHGSHIIVGTPGRVLRLLTKKSLSLKEIRSFVLDEADRMLDMGFHDDILKIASFLPIKRQTLLFSATYPDEIADLSQSILNEPQFIKVDSEHAEDVIEQQFYALDSHKEKDDLLLRVLADLNQDRILIFCKTKQISEAVAKFLRKNGVYAAAIHGDLMQNERTLVLTQFSNHSLSVLVATDVAARGLDIDNLSAVINYDLSSDPEIYVHRIGRTGRAGKCGKAITFFLRKKEYLLESIEELTRIKCIETDMSLLPQSNEITITPLMQTMYIGGGKKDKLRPGDIVGALVNEAKVPFDAIGEISVMNILSYVAVKRELIGAAVKRLQSGKIKNRKFKVGLVDENLD